MKADRLLEMLATLRNGRDHRLGKTGDRCFHIGMWGGCGLRCAAFCDGVCEYPYEFGWGDVQAEFNKDEIAQILTHYPQFIT